MDEKKLRKLAGLNEAVEELLEEGSASKPLQQAFNNDTAIFPIKVYLHNHVSGSDGWMAVEISAASGKYMSNISRLLVKRFGALGRKSNLQSKAELNGGLGGYSIVRFPNDYYTNKDPDAIKLMKILSKSLRISLDKSRSSSPNSDREASLVKEYNSLEELAADLDKLG